jgi:hypothetical protein
VSTASVTSTSIVGEFVFLQKKISFPVLVVEVEERVE